MMYQCWRKYDEDKDDDEKEKKMTVRRSWSKDIS